METVIKIKEIKQNCMGTLDLIAQFNGMRKSQSFIVYPMSKDNATDKIMIQSDTRIGYISLINGDVTLCAPVSSGAYQPHLMFIKKIDCLSIEELAGLKFRLVQIANIKAGNNALHVFVDNSNADKVTIF
jgi:hypothetical protein